MVTFVTTPNELARIAELSDDSGTLVEVARALERLQSPVTINKKGKTVQFTPLINRAGRLGKKLVLEVSVKWFGSPSRTVSTPLVRKNPTALALHLLISAFRTKDSDGISFKGLCSRLRLGEPSARVNDKVNQAVKMLNVHLGKIGENKIRVTTDTADRIHFDHVDPK
jgi:hypothetical protein